MPPEYSLRFRRIWDFRRWLILLPALFGALATTAISFEVSSYFLQEQYFRFLDVHQRHETVLSDKLFFCGRFTLAAGLAIILVFGTTLIVISPGFRRRLRMVAWASGCFVLICLGVIFGAVRFATKPDRSIPLIEPVWTAEIVPADTGIPSYHRTRRMTFTDGGHLVVGTSSDLVSLETKAGHIAATQPTTNPPLLFSSRSSKLLIATGDLELLSPDLRPTGRKISLTGGFVEIASPSGASVVWQHYQGPPKTTLIDTESLKTTETFATCNANAITDHAVAESVVLIHEGVQAIVVCDPGTSTRVFYRGGGGFVYLTNESMLVIDGSRLTLLDSSGKIQAEDEWPDDNVTFAGASRDGSRFAVANERWRWGDPRRINKVSIIVYDTATFRPIVQIPSAWVSALSPDGKSLATSFAGKTSYFKLP
jgi:hypothetical protein